jgi:hypothetical protein
VLAIVSLGFAVVERSFTQPGFGECANSAIPIPGNVLALSIQVHREDTPTSSPRNKVQQRRNRNTKKCLLQYPKKFLSIAGC